MSGTTTSDDAASRRLTKIVYELPYAAIGKPRMTQQDKWKKRPLVENYRAWCDLVRMTMEEIPAPADTYLVIIEARYPPPFNLPKATRRAWHGTLKRTKPDPDNIAKAFLDCWWKEDQAVGDVLVKRRWWDEPMTVITFWLDEGVLIDGGQERPEHDS